jgi:adenylyltransferase/sulfurtransferase
MAGLIGALQALLALERLSGAAGPARGEAQLHVIDGVTLTGRTVRVPRVPDCSSCAPGRMPTLVSPEEAARCTT